MSEPLKCPHCGATEGYYKVTIIMGRGNYFYDAFGNSAEENGGLHDNLSYRELKTKRCVECHGVIKR